MCFLCLCSIIRLQSSKNYMYADQFYWLQFGCSILMMYTKILQTSGPFHKNSGPQNFYIHYYKIWYIPILIYRKLCNRPAKNDSQNFDIINVILLNIHQIYIYIKTKVNLSKDINNNKTYKYHFARNNSIHHENKWYYFGNESNGS